MKPVAGPRAGEFLPAEAAVPAWRYSAPAFLIGAYVFLLPVQFEGGPLARFAPSDLFLLAYLLMRLPRMRHQPSPQLRWNLALVAVMGLSVVVSVVKTGSVTQYALLQKLLGIVVLLVSYLCLVDFLRSFDRIRWVLRVFLSAVVLNALVALVAFLLVDIGGPQIPLVNALYPGVRMAGLLVDPNAFGGIVAVGLVLHVLTAANGTRLLGPGLSWTAGLVLPPALFFSFSRSAWFGLGLGLAGAALWKHRAGGRALRMLAVYALLIAPVMALVVATVVPDAMELILRPSQVDARVTLGADAIGEIEKDPFFGTGLGVYLEKYGNIVHNTVLWFLTEMGIVGLVVLCAFFVSYLNVLRAADRIVPEPGRRSIILALFGAHVAMIGISMGIEALYQRYWWMVLALSSAVYAVASRPPAAEDGGPVPAPARGAS